MDEERIKELFREVLDTHRSIPADQHYEDHNWIKEWREWQKNISNSVWRGLVGWGMTVIIALLLFGFIFWGKTTLTK